MILEEVKQDGMKDDKKELSYKEIHGTTRVGDFLRSIKEVTPDILDFASKATGVSALKSVGELISGNKIITPQDKEKALKELELDIKEAEFLTIKEQEISKRWQSDMHSDSFLSKNIRPYSLAFLLLTVVTILILDSSLKGFVVKEYWVSLLGSLAITAMGGYFALRQIGKFVDKKYTK
jgi:hypothetical protein